VSQGDIVPFRVNTWWSRQNSSFIVFCYFSVTVFTETNAEKEGDVVTGLGIFNLAITFRAKRIIYSLNFTWTSAGRLEGF